MLAGFCTEGAPEEFLNQIVEALLGGDEAKVEALANEATEWVHKWEREVYK
jgi:uncharacterized protein (UPF0297 family)